MRRKILLWHFNSEGCIVKHEGSNYSVFLNILNRKTATVPKHIEINDDLVKRICKDLDIKPLERVPAAWVEKLNG